MGFSIWQLLIVLVIVVLLFGTKKLKNMGSDLGGAFKGFKSAMGDEEAKAKAKEQEQGRIIEGEASDATEATETKEKEKNS